MPRCGAVRGKPEDVLGDQVGTTPNSIASSFSFGRSVARSWLSSGVNNVRTFLMPGDRADRPTTTRSRSSLRSLPRRPLPPPILTVGPAPLSGGARSAPLIGAAQSRRRDPEKKIIKAKVARTLRRRGSDLAQVGTGSSSAPLSRATSKRSRFMTLSQAATKSRTNFSAGVGAGVDLGDGPQLRVASRRRGRRRWPSTGPRRWRGRGPRRRAPPWPTAVHSVPMSSRLTKKSLVSIAGPVGEHAVLGAADVGAQGPQAADEHRHLGRGQREQVGPVEQQRLGRQLLARPAGSCGTRRPSARARRTTRRRSAPGWRRCGPA